LDGWLIAVGYEGNAEAVEWQTQQLVREIISVPLEPRIGSAARPWWDALTESLWPAGQLETLTFKANVLPSAVAAFCQAADQLTVASRLQAHAGNGIVIGRLGPLTLEQATGTLNQLRQRAREARGHVVVLQCPPQWKENVSVWGPAGGDVALMRAIKEKLDPRRIFNPGRFVDGP
jgi:glycolate oxidase FAD binding subunit